VIEKLAGVLIMFVKLWGWAETDGGTQTVNVANELVITAAELVMTTV